MAAEHLHLQHQIVQSYRRVVQACGPVDRQPKESSLQPGKKIYSQIKKLQLGKNVYSQVKRNYSQIKKSQPGKNFTARLKKNKTVVRLEKKSHRATEMSKL